MKNRLRTVRGKSALFLTPSLLGTVILFVLPFSVVVFYALTDYGSKEFVGLENFSRLLQNDAFCLAAKNTGILCALAVPSAVILSLLLALLLQEKLPGKSKFRTAILSPLFVPVASVVMIWRILFHDNGTINALLTQLGADPMDWFRSGAARYMILLLYLWKNLGYNMLLFLSALAGVPREINEAASVDGAGCWRRFFNIQLYYISPTILFVTVISFISAMKIFREVYLLAGAYPGEALYLLQHFMNNTFHSMDYQKLCSAAILLALAMLLIIGVLYFVESRFGKDMEER